MIEKEYCKIQGGCFLCGKNSLYQTPLKDHDGIVRDQIHFCSNCQNARFVEKGQNFDALIFKRLSGYLDEIKENV